MCFCKHAIDKKYIKDWISCEINTCLASFLTAYTFFNWSSSSNSRDLVDREFIVCVII